MMHRFEGHGNEFGIHSKVEGRGEEAQDGEYIYEK